MDIHSTYVRFQQEQHDAINPEQRTRFDEFGHVKPEPTVEGFDGWSMPNPHDRAAIRARVQREDREHAHALDLRRQANEEARKRINRLMAVKVGS
jgi:hypothetical protein